MTSANKATVKRQSQFELGADTHIHTPKKDRKRGRERERETSPVQTTMQTPNNWLQIPFEKHSQIFEMSVGGEAHTILRQGRAKTGER